MDVNCLTCAKAGGRVAYRTIRVAISVTVGLVCDPCFIPIEDGGNDCKNVSDAYIAHGSMAYFEMRRTNSMGG